MPKHRYPKTNLALACITVSFKNLLPVIYYFIFKMSTKKSITTAEGSGSVGLDVTGGMQSQDGAIKDIFSLSFLDSL